ncbi:MAG: RNA methyltransferase [Polaribacter sp.]|nr:RNA methyltransferase [Polaribacter sp.]
MSISKNQLKLIQSLSQKKYRSKHQLFMAEGVKVVNELLHSSFELVQLFATADFICADFQDKKTTISEADLKKVSQLKTPNEVLGLFRIPIPKPISNTGLTVVLDAINDPGNLGTIIRLCDWFGISQLVCSEDTVDCYNPKVVQASMGSLPRISIHYTNVTTYLQHSNLPIFMADMDGENVYKKTLPQEAILILGNEANGVSDAIKQLANQIISIPRFGEIQQTESLNVATATAILLSEFRRGS